jgi:hypothetical protein
VRAWVAVATLAGCDGVFHVDPLHKAIDAPPGVGPDASLLACPPIGAPPFEFGSAPTLVTTGCSSYSVDSADDLAAAFCTSLGIAQSVPDAAMMKPTSISSGNATTFVSGGWLAASGNEIVTIVFDNNNVQPQAVAVATLGTAWSNAVAQAIDGSTMSTYTAASPPTATTPRRMFVAEIGMTALLHHVYELEQVAGSQNAWMSFGGAYASSDLVPTAGEFLESAALTADGLRLVFATSGANIYYAERMTLGERFGTGQKVYSNAAAPFLTADCRKLYFVMGGSSIAYVRRTR